jgi:nitrate reductase (NAD(P)H)
LQKSYSLIKLAAKCPKTEKNEQPTKTKPAAPVKPKEQPQQERDISDPPVQHVKGIDERDKGTPDDWIPRHHKLIRLTGRHPLNAEPELSILLSDMLTPASLHYVRNHGAVPKLDWDSHRISVSGHVKSPREFSMQDILSLPTVTLPVTLTCDGNRRKELNMIKHSRAFHWGPGATGTAVWKVRSFGEFSDCKGVKLCDVLKMCEVVNVETYHVCFEGADELAKDHYATSIPLSVAMDTTHDVILAFEMNGERLTPDHGFPIRVIIPGFVGGRMVKWLTKITISEVKLTFSEIS